MAKKNKRPQSEIDAPEVPEPVHLVQNTGMNRAERRSKGIRGPGLSSNRPYRRRS